MKWNKKYTLGIAAIDAQHKQLFRLSDDLDTALQAGIRTEDLDSAGLVERQETHKIIVHRFSELHQKLATDGLSAELINLLQQELSGWIRDHVTGMDQEFGNFYKSRG